MRDPTGVHDFVEVALPRDWLLLLEDERIEGAARAELQHDAQLVGTVVPACGIQHGILAHHWLSCVELKPRALSASDKLHDVRVLQRSHDEHLLHEGANRFIRDLLRPNCEGTRRAESRRCVTH